MSKIILQPAGNPDGREHYNDTIANPIELKSISKFLKKEELKDLYEIYEDGKCYVWGVTPGGNNKTKWDRIDSGDVTLFARDGGVFASAVTTYKLVNEELAAHLWGYMTKYLEDMVQRFTWENIYFVDEIRSHNIPYLDLNRVVGYKENYIIQGFSVLDEDRSYKVFQEFGLESSVYIKPIETNKYDNEVIPFFDETEEEYIAKRRLEQGYFRKKLFKNKTNIECACCSKLYPKSFVWCSHIKKRAKCSDEEKRDINVVVPMCKFGCDDLFEKGYIGVDENGQIVNLKKASNSNIIKYIDNLKGKKLSWYTSKNAKYFKWHSDYHI